MSDLQFSTALKGVNIYGLNKYLGVPELDISDDQSAVTIDFHIDIEARIYGIKGMDVFIDKVVTEFYWSVWDDGIENADREKLFAAGGTEKINDDIEGKIELDTTSPVYSDWEIINEMKFDAEYGSLSPSDVEIDFGNKTITIS